MNRPILKLVLASVLLCVGLPHVGAQETQVTGQAEFSMGNGEKNWIDVKGVTRNRSTMTFLEVQIDGNGWLVVHPFENGAPNGDKYVASTYLRDGKNLEMIGLDSLNRAAVEAVVAQYLNPQ